MRNLRVAIETGTLQSFVKEFEITWNNPSNNIEEKDGTTPTFFDPTLFLLFGFMILIYFLMTRPENKKGKLMKIC